MCSRQRWNDCAISPSQVASALVAVASSIHACELGPAAHARQDSFIRSRRRPGKRPNRPGPARRSDEQDRAADARDPDAHAEDIRYVRPGISQNVVPFRDIEKRRTKRECAAYPADPDAVWDKGRSNCDPTEHDEEDPQLRVRISAGVIKQEGRRDVEGVRRSQVGGPVEQGPDDHACARKGDNSSRNIDRRRRGCRPR